MNEWEKPEAIEKVGKTVATIGMTLTGMMKAMTELKKALRGKGKVANHIKPSPTETQLTETQPVPMSLLEVANKLVSNEGKVIGILNQLIQNQNALIARLGAVEAVLIQQQKQEAKGPKGRTNTRHKPGK